MVAAAQQKEGKGDQVSKMTINNITIQNYQLK